MSRFGTEYHIARSTGRCSATGQPLEPGSACIATLCERADDEGFDRRDFSLQAWEAGSRPPGLFSHWKTVVAPPGAKPRLLVDDEVLFDLFTRLAADDRPQRVAFRFVLGLILIRKKVLKFTGRRLDGEVERWLLQPKSSSGGFESARPPVELVNPRLADDDVRQLIEQLSEILQSEL
ncbi:MAG: hypothetical protein L0Y44_09945 [Phycisphaerales bacterium]|nr:hypothetical protein [Phycisphaerales bacterium]MCI0630958.1 hypothetical protein [Phycisphaerales bacterium]MCI0674321.1 hypothetical protein [Phycisphaerales bacterium]